MREKKDYMVLTFHTTTEAMEMEKKCGERHIPGRLIPVPRAITAGCGLAWRIAQAEYESHRAAIDALGISFQQAVALKL
ncbi:MAG: DUF3343 domain-containing protein [Butyricicoccus sp.]